MVFSYYSAIQVVLSDCLLPCCESRLLHNYMYCFLKFC